MYVELRKLTFTFFLPQGLKFQVVYRISVYPNTICILLYDKNTTNNIVPDIQWILRIYYIFLNKSGR